MYGFTEWSQFLQSTIQRAILCEVKRKIPKVGYPDPVSKNKRKILAGSKQVLYHRQQHK